MEVLGKVQPSAPYDYELDKNPECLKQLRRFAGCFGEGHVLRHISMDEETLQTIGNCSPVHSQRCRCSFSFIPCCKQCSREVNNQQDDIDAKQHSANNSDHAQIRSRQTSGDAIEGRLFARLHHSSTGKEEGFATSNVSTKCTKTSDTCTDKSEVYGKRSPKKPLQSTYEYTKMYKKVIRKRRLVKGVFTAAWIVLFPVMVVAVIARGRSDVDDDEEDRRNDPLLPWYYKVHTSPGPEGVKKNTEY